MMAKVPAIESSKFPSVHASVTYVILNRLSMGAYNFYAQTPKKTTFQRGS